VHQNATSWLCGHFCSYVHTGPIRNAGEDGIKVHQAKRFTFTGNVIENAGTGNGGNFDGVIDFVAVTDSHVEGNAVVRTGGNSCLMMKGGTARNTVTGNSFAGCKDAIHVGGKTGDKWRASGSGGKEAYNNTITGNNLCGRETPIYMFEGERQRRDNTINGNSCSGRNVGPTLIATGGYDAGYAPLDGEKIARDIRTMLNSGTPPESIKYILGLDGIVAPDDVVNGSKTVQDAIADGSLKQEAPPTTWTPPPMQAAPTPDLTPKGSSDPGWRSNINMPTLESMRRTIMDATKPPRC
jgi:hypothetical protein